MTRVSLGHTGRVLTASSGTTTIYVAAVLAAVMRIVAPSSGLPYALLVGSGIMWTLAFAGFIGFYGSFLIAMRSDRASAC